MKAYEVVRHHIEQQILDGELRVGSLLAPERELAAELGVSRTAVREALRTLQAQGLVTSQVGAGPNSGTRISDQPSDALGTLLEMHVALSQFALDDVIEARIMLERESVKGAAARHDADGIAKLGDLLAEMGPLTSIDAFNELDTRFHVLIAELAGNTLVAVLTTGVRQALAVHIRKASYSLADYEPFRQDLMRQHRRVFEAIVRGDSDAAADLMEDHIRTAYTILPMNDADC